MRQAGQAVAYTLLLAQEGLSAANPEAAPADGQNTASQPPAASAPTTPAPAEAQTASQPVSAVTVTAPQT